MVLDVHWPEAGGEWDRCNRQRGSPGFLQLNQWGEAVSLVRGHVRGWSEHSG
jgi:hypothetical protein